jgi:hypothetical protein
MDRAAAASRDRHFIAYAFPGLPIYLVMIGRDCGGEAGVGGLGENDNVTHAL